jgi:hypothetical protein
MSIYSLAEGLEEYDTLATFHILISEHHFVGVDTIAYKLSEAYSLVYTILFDAPI